MIRLLRLVLLVLALSVAAFSQVHVFPALDTNNTWTGTNTFAGGVTFNGNLFPLTPGAATVGTPSNPFGSVYVGNAATNNIQITGTATGARVFTLPDANSNPVQPSTAGANQFANGISSSGVISYAIPTIGTLSGSIALAQTPLTTRGDLLVVGAGPALGRLPLGGTNLYLKSNGTDTVFSTLAAGGIGTCTNQVVTSLNADAGPTCSTLSLSSAFFANQGATTTVLHGNAAGNPVFSGISLTADAAANQGATTTVLHGNAAGQPSFGAVSLTTDVSGILPAGNGGTGTGSAGTTTTVLHGGGAGFTGLSLTADTSANQGTVNTLLHGNAAGQPTFSGVAPADTTGTTGSGTVFALQVSPSFTTPVLGAATGTSLNLGATGVLSTTAQSGTGSLCMTISCAMTTPNIGAATATSIVTPFITTGAVDKIIIVDGTKYPLTNAGIQSAITDSPTGGTVLVVGQTIPMTGAGTELILINKSLRFICGGWGSSASGPGVLTVGSAVGATVDAIHIKGTAPIEGIEIANCQILAQSGTPGRHDINIDTTTFPISKVWIHNNYLGPLGGKGIVSTNPTPLTDGWFTSVIANNVIWNGELFQNAGDTIIVKENVITGANIALDATFVAGAGKLVFEKNNVTSTGAGLHIGNKVAGASIISNEFEGSVGVTGSNGAYVDLDGATGSLIQAPLIWNNQISPVATNIDGLRLNFVDSARVEGVNIFARSGGTGVDIRITANAASATNYIDYSNYYFPTTDTQSQILSDAGTSRVLWAFPYSSAANGGVGNGIQFNTTFSANAIIPINGIFNSTSSFGFLVPTLTANANLVGDSNTQTVTGKTFQAPNGSASTPPYAFANSTNTGWYSSGAGNIFTSIAGTDLEAISANLRRQTGALVLGWVPSTTVSGVLSDVNISRNQPGVIQIGTGETANFGGSIKLNGVTFTNETQTAVARQTWGGNVAPTVSLNGANTIAQWTPSKALVLERIEGTISAQAATCTVAPKVRISDGTNASDMPITNGTVGPFTTAFAQNYNGGTLLTMSSIAGTCTVNPQGMQITATFRSQ